MNTQYTIFETTWGYFGLAAQDNRLLRSILPCKTQKETENHLLPHLEYPIFRKNLFSDLQKDIKSYFKGIYKEFPTNIPLDLDNFSTFQKSILTACRQIKPEKTISYAQLARSANHPNAARATGSTLKINPLPLIIPCHRIIRANNTPGQFSAQGGAEMKIKLLEHERKLTR